MPLFLPLPLRVSKDRESTMGETAAQVLLLLAEDFLGSENKTGVLLGTNVRSTSYYFE